jgi:hypothetical protein
MGQPELSDFSKLGARREVPLQHQNLSAEARHSPEIIEIAVIARHRWDREVKSLTWLQIVRLV